MNFEDVTYDDYPAQIWTVVEISVAIIIACMPVCRIVIEHLLPVSFLPNSRRYLRTTGKSGNQLLKSVDRPLTSREQPAQDVYSVLDEEIEGIQLRMPEAAAAAGKKDRMDIEWNGDDRGLRYTAEANRTSSHAASALEGNGKTNSDVEAGNSIAVQHDVVVTRQER